MTDSKLSVTNRFLETYSDVNVHLDAKCQGVWVPEIHSKNRELALRVGFSLHPPIHDLVVDTWGILCTLSFGGRPHLCKIPWRAVWGLTTQHSHEQVIWEEHRPKMPVGYKQNVSKDHQEYLDKAKAGNKALAAMQEAKKQLPQRHPPGVRKLPVGWKLIKGDKQ
jgi:stringent starvation protein B